MNALTEFEQAVLDKLLYGDHPVLISLQTQLAQCNVVKREFSGVGFFTDFTIPDEMPAAPTRNKRIRFGDVIADVIGLEYGVGFVLFVDDGKLTMFEGYTFDESWPERPRIRGLAYTSEPRDLSELD